MDTLNFCFWSDEPTLFTVSYQGRQWTGYRSLCAALARAKEVSSQLAHSFGEFGNHLHVVVHVRILNCSFTFIFLLTGKDSPSTCHPSMAASPWTSWVRYFVPRPTYPSLCWRGGGMHFMRSQPYSMKQASPGGHC